MLKKYFDEIAQDTGRYCFMVDDTLKALDLGAVENLIIWENLEITRFELRNSSTGEITIAMLDKSQEGIESNFRDKETGAELETVSREPLVEWMAENYKQYGCNLQFITDRSSEGIQFVKGFGGIGGDLRWKVDFQELNSFEDNAARHAANDDEDDSDSDSNAGSDDYGFDDGDFGF